MMLNILGSHGAGDDHETETPYVLWGSGFITKYNVYHNTESLNLERRLDIQQADLTPLMSSILSIPVPVNSIVSNKCIFNFILIY